jgi:hypothetical protein
MNGGESLAFPCGQCDEPVGADEALWFDAIKLGARDESTISLVREAGERERP